MKLRSSLILLVPLLAQSGLPARGDEPFRYPSGRHGQGELRYIDEVPVLIVQGTPEEVGAQIGTLALKPAESLTKIGDGFIKAQGWEAVYPLLLKTGNIMAPRFPADHRQELEAVAAASGWSRDLLIFGNTIPDLRKIAGCSTLYVAPARSTTGGALFGRNLDWPPFGTLHEYTLVTVYRVKGKRAFASIGFPGMLGCVSGINDAGLALADLTVTSANDGSRQLDATGTPYTLALRRVLEECASIEEAEKLLRSLKRTTMQNVAICDRTKGAVFEITTKNLVVRRAVEGVCACTNHFRTEQLATTGTDCARYAALDKCREAKQVDIAGIAARLDEVGGPATLQTMIFEPATLKVHLAYGKGNATQLPRHTVPLAGLFALPDDAR